MTFDYWQVVPLIGIGLTIPIWIWLFLTRTKHVNNEDHIKKEE